MLQVRKNEISLRKWSGGTTQLRTLEQGFPTFLWSCTPSEFRQLNMHLWNFLWQKGWV